MSEHQFQLQGLDHVALHVRDLARSVAWYGDVLGLQRRHEDAWGDRPAVMAAGDSGVALFAVDSRQAGPRPDNHAVAMRHLAFRADRGNFDRARHDLKRRGIEFEFEDHHISHSIYFRDPDGHLIEITTYDV